jgi:hypothetical protein
MATWASALSTFKVTNTSTISPSNLAAAVKAAPVNQAAIMTALGLAVPADVPSTAYTVAGVGPLAGASIEYQSVYTSGFSANYTTTATGTVQIAQVRLAHIGAPRLGHCHMRWPGGSPSRT